MTEYENAYHLDVVAILTERYPVSSTFLQFLINERGKVTEQIKEKLKRCRLQEVGLFEVEAEQLQAVADRGVVGALIDKHSVYLYDLGIETVMASTQPAFERLAQIKTSCRSQFSFQSMETPSVR